MESPDLEMITQDGVREAEGVGFRVLRDLELLFVVRRVILLLLQEDGV